MLHFLGFLYEFFLLLSKLTCVQTPVFPLMFESAALNSDWKTTCLILNPFCGWKTHAAFFFLSFAFQILHEKMKMKKEKKKPIW